MDRNKYWLQEPAESLYLPNNVEECSYRGFFENALEGIFRTAPNGRFLMVNPALASMLGYASLKDVISSGAVFSQLFANSESYQEYLSRIQEHGALRGFEFESRGKDGAKIWLSTYSQALRDSSGTVLYYEGKVEDITKRKQVDESLRQTLEWQNAFFEGSRDGILISDENAKIMAANEAACKITGYSKEELLTMQSSDLQEEADLAVLAKIHERILSGEDIRGEVVITTKAGRNLAVEFSHHRVVISGVPFVHSTVRDISLRKQLEAQLMQAQKMEAIGSLAGGVAHDFNNLLSVIKGYTELLLDELAPDDPKREDLLQIEKAGQRAASLTSQLLSFSRKQMLQPELLDLNVAINDMNLMLRRLLGENIELIMSAQPNLGSVYADPGQIQQIVMNLAVNARDAMTRGGKLIIETSYVEVDESYIRSWPFMKKGSYIMIAVSDNGIGMDAATQARIFEPFFTTKEKGKGTGLGLSTVYGIVKQSNGFILVDSEMGKGTTFKVYFPCIDGEASKSTNQNDSLDAAQEDETILLVEDEDSVRALAHRILSERGYNVLEAADGVEALKRAQEFGGTIDLVLTDVVMPGISGTTLIARLGTMRPGIKSLYMSGYTDDSIINHGFLDSSVAFLQKPFTVQNLAQKVREVLSDCA